MDYRKRIADSLVETSLKCMGAVLIEGTKWCGKSTTAGQHCKSAIYMDDPARRSVYEILADDSISLIIDGETPRLIDEWQINPKSGMRCATP